VEGKLLLWHSAEVKVKEKAQRKPEVQTLSLTEGTYSSGSGPAVVAAMILVVRGS